MITIHVNDDVWKKLNSLKKSGETMDDVIRKLLEIFSKAQENIDAGNEIEIISFDELLEEFCTIADEEFRETIEGTRRSFQKGILGE